MAGSNRIARKRARSAAAATAHAAIARRAAGYVRVSTEEQATHGHGLAVQRRAIEAFAASQGYELVEVEADPGVSGATVPAERPGFGRLLALAGAGEISLILVWKFDRLARNIRHAITTVHDEINGRGAELRSVTEAAIDTGSPMGRMIFAIFAGMAEGERETITLRTWTGRRASAQTGALAGGATPYGYRRTGRGELAIEPAEAAIVREIFALRADGLILQAIADRLNGAGHRGRRGGAWTPGSVAYLLDNEKYHGRLEYLFSHDGSDTHVIAAGRHEAIVRAT